jgi:hypothetical protein
MTHRRAMGEEASARRAAADAARAKAAAGRRPAIEGHI